MKNKGFSLVEMVVTVLITAIVATVVITGVSYYRSADTTAGIKKLSAALEKTRLETMSRTAGSVALKLYYDSGRGEYYADIIYMKTENEIVSQELIDTYNIGSDTLTVKAAKYNTDGITETESTAITDAEGIEISFAKSSGVYLPDTDGLYFSRIIIEGAKTESIILVKDTGRTYVE